MRLSFIVALVAGGAAIAAAQQQSEPFPPSAEQRARIEQKRAELAAAVRKLRSDKLRPELLADVEIYQKAADWILRYPEEFFVKQSADNTLRVIDSGLQRAAELRAGKPSWTSRTGRVVRAYRSRVDGSVQPYIMALPDGYDPAKLYRLDVVLHGRNARLNEVSFITSAEFPPPGKEPPAPPPDCIELHVFGRTNNAYRWAGETDVFEAMESARSRYRVRDGDIVLRGFSMGGAGAWHLGLHYPDRWAAFEAGAGFTETRNYARIPNPPEWETKAMHIYDAADYARNGVNVPFVGYGGELDKQLQASVNVRDKLVAEGFDIPNLRALFLVGTQTEHRWHPDSHRQSEEFLTRALAESRAVPAEVLFVTYTLRYNRCHWVRVDRLHQHYRRAEVDARREGERTSVRTRNVARLTLDRGGHIEIDGQTLEAPAGRGPSLEQQAGVWRVSQTAPTGLAKKHGLQGPIDDAFLDSFLVVRGTGKTNHAAAAKAIDGRLETLRTDFPKWLRGNPRTTTDTALRNDEIRNHHLVLFGDPSSNAVLRKIAKQLPIQWDANAIRAGGQTYPAVSHFLVMIYPNPLNPDKYVVLNTGHSFGEKEFRGTNALLYPRFGDYAILALDGNVVDAGYFDEDWKLADGGIQSRQ